MPAGDVVEAMHVPSCGAEGVAQGGLSPVREVAGAELGGGPGVSVALLDGEAQYAVVVADCASGAGEQVPELGSIEVEQDGVCRR